MMPEDFWSNAKDPRFRFGRSGLERSTFLRPATSRHLRHGHIVFRQTQPSVSEEWLQHLEKIYDMRDLRGEWLRAFADLEAVLRCRAAASTPSTPAAEPWLQRRALRPPARMERLAEELKVNSARKTATLRLGGMDVGDAGAQTLAGMLNLNRKIDLRYNEIGNAGALALAEAIKANKTVRGISLGHNEIGDEGALALAETIKMNQTVTNIYLNNQIGDAGVLALAEAIKRNHTVKEIDLSRNQIGSAGKKAIDEAIQVNKSVKVLGLIEADYSSENSDDADDDLSIFEFELNLRC